MICRALIVIGLIVSLAAIANAEPAAELEPIGTRVTRPHPMPGCNAEQGCDGKTSTRWTVRFAVTRDSLDRARAADELAKERRKLWLECEARAARLVQGEPRWLTAVRYVSVGILIGGAFSLGVLAAE